ncbi:MAG TPA: TlyA family RNA methyltransferase [Acidobacteriaceae bacterium]|jgi:23S rRNA (cytidine1920-2'-O)/16S rRNA (cytidine1409-2'-O)-methyltransferase
MKIRLDKLLVDRGHAASRERAQALILAGRVLVAEQKVDKPGSSVDSDVVVRMLGEDLRYVSRGGLKLEYALERWKIDLGGKACVDIGASTGGFTDCMLQHGAASVLAVDTGYGQIAHKLRADSRVTLMERTNARLLAPGALLVEGPGPFAFFCMDVSFISATLVLPAVVGALAVPGAKWSGEAVVLIKPQFEAGREHVGKGGIVRDPAAQQLAVDRVTAAVDDIGGSVLEVVDSPILGMEGNREFLAHVRLESDGSLTTSSEERVLKPFSLKENGLL